jgi:hypothetical protein
MEGKVRAMAIMTGVQSDKILGNRVSYKSVLEEQDRKTEHPKIPQLPKNRKARDFTSGGNLLEWVG